MSLSTEKRRIVAVLGGNAFVAAGESLTMDGQLQFAQQAIRSLIPLIQDDVELLVSHGNGPQVGHILIRVEAALGQAYPLPLEACVAESEGELGYVLQQALYNELAEQHNDRQACALLTHVVIDEDDPAMRHPDKPIGPFFDQPTAERMRSEGLNMVEDAGRGYRRVVPSPQPREVLEIEVIDRLLSMNVIVIAAGGGGIPVSRRDDRLTGVEAVIDKDRTAGLLAQQLGAELLIILTGVPCAYRHFGSDRQTRIGQVDVDAARQLIDEGHFAPGSMLPKMEAAIRFTAVSGRPSIICDPASLSAALQGRAGTIIEPSSAGAAPDA